MRRSLSNVALLLLLPLGFFGFAHAPSVIADGQFTAKSTSSFIHRDQNSLRETFLPDFPSDAPGTIGHPQWKTHQGVYNVVAVSMNLPGQLPAPSVAKITEVMKGDGAPTQGEPSVQLFFANIGVHLRIRVDKATLRPIKGIDATTCDTGAMTLEYTQALAQDPSVARADAVVIFTPHKPHCHSGGVTLGTLIEVEEPDHGWIDPRMIEHELGHGLLGLAHSGLTSTVGKNVLDRSTTMGNQYGPDSVMGAGTVGWSGPNQLVAGNMGMNQVVTASTTGDYRIRRRELGGNTTDAALLRIPLKAHTGFYQGNPQEEVVLEYEVQTGADSASRFGKAQVLVETWTEQKMPDTRLVAMTWEVGRLTPNRPTFTINLPTDQVAVTVVSQDNHSVKLHVDVQ